MEKVKVTLKGLTPLLMHAPTGVDTTHPLTKQKKAITSKRKKTDADVEDIDWLEYQLALYHDGSRPVMPATCVLGSLRDGAKANRLGREIQAGVDIAEMDIPLTYEGPTAPRELYDARFSDRRMVKNKGGGGSVMRVRPRFNTWALTFTLLIDEQVIDPKDVQAAMEYAGLRKGIGDFRPRFGRFEVSAWGKAR